MTRYRLPAELGGGEIEAIPQGTIMGSMGHRYQYWGDGYELWFETALTEVEPPIPDEPEPGAYDIGGVLCVRWAADKSPSRWAFGTGSSAAGVYHCDWPELWAELGAPRRSPPPIRLVPDPAQDVELPWRCGDLYIERLDATSGLMVEVNFQDRWVRLDADEARQAAAALLAAAEATDD